MEFVGLNEYVNTKRSKNTQVAVFTHLSGFIRFITSCEKGEENNASLQWLNSNPDLFCVLRDYVQFLNDNCEKGHYSPLTVHNAFQTVSLWLKWNGYYLEDREIQPLKAMLPRRVLVHMEAEISRETIRVILHHSDIQMKALILLLSSSGMRINEALGIHQADIVIGEPSEVSFSGRKMKARVRHTYFFSAEAAAAIAEWVKIRDVYLLQSVTRAKNISRTYENTSLFGMTSATAGKKLRRILEAAKLYEYDEEGKRGTITFHAFRKWMESTSKLHQPENIVNALIGHDEGLSKHYRRYTAEQLREAYKAVEPYLCIEAPATYAELQGETKQALNEQNAVIVSLVKDMQSQKEELNSQLSEYRIALLQTRQEIAELRQWGFVQGKLLEFNELLKSGEISENDFDLSIMKESQSQEKIVSELQKQIDRKRDEYLEDWDSRYGGEK